MASLLYALFERGTGCRGVAPAVGVAPPHPHCFQVYELTQYILLNSEFPSAFCLFALAKHFPVRHGGSQQISP
jgi:hypothetical protein